MYCSWLQEWFIVVSFNLLWSIIVDDEYNVSTCQLRTLFTSVSNLLSIFILKSHTVCNKQQTLHTPNAFTVHTCLSAVRPKSSVDSTRCHLPRCLRSTGESRLCWRLTIVRRPAYHRQSLVNTNSYITHSRFRR